MTELHLSPNTPKRDGCTTAHCPPTSPAPGPHGLHLMVANLDTGIYAFLSSIVSPSLKLLCRLPAFRISEIIIRSCHISLQYLTFFFHSKSGSNCQQADLSSRRVSPFEGINLSPSQGSQKPQLALTWHFFFIRRPVGMAENHEKQILWLASMVKLLDTNFLATRVWFLNGMWPFCVLGTQSEKWKPLTKVSKSFIHLINFLPGFTALLTEWNQIISDRTQRPAFLWTSESMFTFSLATEHLGDSIRDWMEWRPLGGGGVSPQVCRLSTHLRKGQDS